MVAGLDRVLTRWPLDRNRIAVTGLSHGGYMATYLTAVEPGIRAGSQIGGFTPFTLPDVVPPPADLLRKIAPKPFLLMAGIFDPLKFVNADWIQEYSDHVRLLYGSLGRLDIMPGASEHEYNWSLSKRFFDEVLPVVPQK